MPEVLDRPARDGYEIVIFGAGCSGLSLCYYLLEEGIDAPILILDRRRTFEDDRTWCFWDVEPTPFTDLALTQWRSWSFASAAGHVTQTTRRYPYKCLTGRDFYEHALDRLARAPNVTLRLGEDVRGYAENGEVVHVETAERTYFSRYVFDGRGLAPGSPAFEEARRKARRWVPQKFLGLRVWTARPVFDPERCILMDFSVDQSRGLRFAYVLPFGSQEALVENVYFSEAAVTPEEHRLEISAYLESTFGLALHEVIVLGEEKGYIPMTDHSFTRAPRERVHNIGMLGGETRPSTGYTFLRIQRRCRQLARTLAKDGASSMVHPRRFDLLDGLLLEFVRERPEECPEVYHRMFAGVPPDSLVRFLTEKSTPADEALLVRALPKTPFLKLAARSLLERVQGS